MQQLGACRSGLGLQAPAQTHSNTTSPSLVAVMLLAGGAGGGAESVWRVEGGVGAPHDFTLAAAPMPAHGTGDRALAVYIAETKATDSQLRKFIFLPEGCYLLLWQTVLFVMLMTFVGCSLYHGSLCLYIRVGVCGFDCFV